MALRTRPSRAGSLSAGAGTTNSIGLPAVDSVSINAGSLAGKRSANPFRSLIKKFKSKDELTARGGNDSDSDLDFECGGLSLEEHEDETYHADLFITNPNPALEGSAHIDSARSDVTFTSTASSPSLSQTDSSVFFSGASSARSSATFSSISSHSSISEIGSLCTSPERVARHIEPETEEEAVLRRQKEDQAAIDALEAYFALHVKPSAALAHPNVDEYGRRASSPNTATTSSSTFVRPSLRNRRSETSLILAAHTVRYNTKSRRPSVGPVAEHPASPTSPTKQSSSTSTITLASRQRSYTYANASPSSSNNVTPSASPITTSPLPYKLNSQRSFSASQHTVSSPTSEPQAYPLPSSSILSSRAGSRRGSIAHGIVNQPYI